MGPLKDVKYLLLVRRKAGAVTAIDANCGRSQQGGSEGGREGRKEGGSGSER